MSIARANPLIRNAWSLLTVADLLRYDHGGLLVGLIGVERLVEP